MTHETALLTLIAELRSQIAVLQLDNARLRAVKEDEPA